MKLVLQDNNIENYLKDSDIINYKNQLLEGYGYRLVEGIKNNTDKIKRIYEYVRDNINHTFDIEANDVTCRASEVLEKGHGVCYAKSHLLTALLRGIGIPSGFCYQGLIFDDLNDRRIILHGLIGVYVEEVDKWIRLDARGNKPDVNAQFSLWEEKLAFPVRSEFGEFDNNIIYSFPSSEVLNSLLKSRNKAELILNLPESI